MKSWGPTDMFNSVWQWMEAAGQAGSGPLHPKIPDAATVELRRKLLKEEMQETLDGMDAEDLVAVADGLADVLYVTMGAAVAYGIDIRPIFDEVQASNITKLGGPKRADGKQGKGPNYRPPNIRALLRKQGANV